MSASHDTTQVCNVRSILLAKSSQSPLLSRGALSGVADLPRCELAYRRRFRVRQRYRYPSAGEVSTPGSSYSLDMPARLRDTQIATIAGARTPRLEKRLAMSLQPPSSRHPRPQLSPHHASAGPAPRTSLRPAQLVRVSTAAPVAPASPGSPHSAADPHLYAWDALATTQRRAVLGLLDATRRRRRRTRRRAAIFTLLLILFVVSLLAVMVFGLAPTFTLSF
jgi:hypothetical protein